MHPAQTLAAAAFFNTTKIPATRLVRTARWIFAGLAFLVLFLSAFVLHAVGGARLYNEDQAELGNPRPVTTCEYIKTSRFWFESLQNRQSEFLAIRAMVLLSIHLRQAHSPESKPVDASHWKTGKD